VLSESKAAQVSWAATNKLLYFHGFDMPEWEKLDCWQQEWLIRMIQMFRMGCSPEDVQKDWCETGNENGWVYGEKRDPDAHPPTHPLLQEWTQLGDWGRAVFGFLQYMVTGVTLNFPVEA
jgi:hypothetical protein